MPEKPLTPEEITDRVAWWQVELGLEDWTMTVIVEADREKHIAHCSKWDACYRKGELYFDPDRVPRWELDAFIVHELASHPLIWEIAQMAHIMAGKNKRLRRIVEAAEEGAATMLEKLILKLRPPFA